VRTFTQFSRYRTDPVASTAASNWVAMSDTCLPVRVCTPGSAVEARAKPTLAGIPSKTAVLTDLV